MLQPIVIWPNLDLTPEEREIVGHYATPEKPGVLRRTYGAQLLQSNIAGDQQRPEQLVSFSGRRVRVFAMTFTGDLDAWLLEITNPAGTRFTNGEISVASMLNRAFDSTTTPMIPEYFGPALGFGGAPYISKQGAAPVLFDPNIVIEGTDSLIFRGRLGQPWVDLALNPPPPQPPPPFEYRGILNIAVHVWEFPEYPRERPVVGKGSQVTHRMVKGVR